MIRSRLSLMASYYTWFLAVWVITLTVIYINSYVVRDNTTFRMLSREDGIECYDRKVIPRRTMRGGFWVLYNFFPAKRRFHCYESITYTTHADLTFLDNLSALLERWRGPVSLAIHAPGSDFEASVRAIRYAQDCCSPLIRELVTFHLYFNVEYLPKEISVSTSNVVINCSGPRPWTNASLYRHENKLLYPVNVGRNIAREEATTHYVLPSDIELYPSPGLIPAFLDMVRRGDTTLRSAKPKVFPLSIFEIEEGAPMPCNKTQLVEMLRNGSAIPFHQNICRECHALPGAALWLEKEETPSLSVLLVSKRAWKYAYWEPIFIGTRDDPLYDERLSWEGRSDKMTQGYAMCALGYDFMILDNAFLVHKPGIKMLKNDTQREILEWQTKSLIQSQISRELRLMYGERPGCEI